MARKNRPDPEAWVAGAQSPESESKPSPEVEPEQRLTVDIPVSVYKKLKIEAFQEGILLKDLATKIFKAYQQSKGAE